MYIIHLSGTMILKTEMMYENIVRAGFSFESSDHLEKPENYPLVSGCDTLTPKQKRFSNIQQTTNP